MAITPEGLPDLHSRPGLIDRGYTDYRLGAMCRREELLRLRPGAYVDPAAYADAEKRDQYLLRILAAMDALRQPAVVSHVSAAVLHGLPLWDVSVAKVHFTRSRPGGGTSNNRKIMHALPLDERDVTTIDGVPVTTLARTIADVARMGLFTPAVIMGDHALNNARIDMADLLDAASRIRGCKGAGHVGAAISAMDHRSESPGETRCRLVLPQAGIAPGTLQRVIRHNGRFIARVDFADEEHGVVTEFDGMAKYKLDGASPEAQAEVLAAEKQREEELTGLGLRVVRIVWKDLSRPDVIAKRHAQARALAARSGPPLWDPPRADDEYRPRPR